MGGVANLPEQVWGRIMIGTPTSCWPWVGGQIGSNGYGCFVIGKKSYLAHRIVFSLANPGKIDLRRGQTTKNSKIVMHLCDNKLCCNPKHLKLGTLKENTKDMISKGRRANFKGEKGQNAKLTNEQVKQIRKICSLGIIEQKEIALLCGVSMSTISDIKSNKVYVDVH